MGGAGEGGHFDVPVVEQKLHVLDRSGIGKIAFVELQHIRNIGQIQVEASKILVQIREALDVFLHFFVLRIGHKDNAIHTPQHQLTGGVVDDLPRNGVKLELGLEAFDGHRLNGQEIEKQSPI